MTTTTKKKDNLRGDIDFIISLLDDVNYRAYTKRILRAISKRINSINDLPDSIKNGDYHGDEEFWAGYGLGFDKAMELTKQELSK